MKRQAYILWVVIFSAMVLLSSCSHQVLKRKNITYQEFQDKEHCKKGTLTYLTADSLIVIAQIKNCQYHGAYRSFYADGTFCTTGKYKKGEMHGEWKWYMPNTGSVYRLTVFRKGVAGKTILFTPRF